MNAHPTCGKPLTHTPGFRTWCPDCGWNAGPALHTPRGPLEAIYRQIGSCAGERLFESLRTASPEALRPRATLGVIASLVLCAMIHLSTLALFALGIYAMVVDWPNWFLLAVGGFLALSAWALAPKPERMPEHAVSRDAAPLLYGLADRVAGALGTSPVDVICVNIELNASMGAFGWRHRRVLTLGVPLWLCLDGEEKLALVAHEMAHKVNNDVARAAPVAWAMRALAYWRQVLRHAYNPDWSLPELLGHYVLRALSVPVQMIFSALIHLFWHESQRAEYLADHLGSRVSGSVAYTRCFERLEVVISRADDLVQCTRKFANDPARIIPAFRQCVEAVPEIERQRIKRAGLGALTTLDATHPPTVYRSRLVEAFPAAPQLSVSEMEAEALDGEVAKHFEKLGMDLVREHQGLI